MAENLGLVGNDGVKVLVEELNKIPDPGNGLVTLFQIRRAINSAVLRLPPYGSPGAQKLYDACQAFEHHANEEGGWYRYWTFNRNAIQNLINKVVEETNG